MPNYPTHVAVNLAGVTMASAAAWSLSSIPLPLIGAAAASAGVATFFLSPDLDLKHSNPSRNWWLLKSIWYPYQKAFRHRGLSHSIMISSLTRIVYLLTVLALAAALAQLLLATWLHGYHGIDGSAIADTLYAVGEQATRIFRRHIDQFAAFGVGIWLSDFLHIAADRVATALKIVARL